MGGTTCGGGGASDSINRFRMGDERMSGWWELETASGRAAAADDDDDILLDNSFSESMALSVEASRLFLVRSPPAVVASSPDLHLGLLPLERGLEKDAFSGLRIILGQLRSASLTSSLKSSKS